MLEVLVSVLILQAKGLKYMKNLFSLTLILLIYSQKLIQTHLKLCIFPKMGPGNETYAHETDHKMSCWALKSNIFYNSIAKGWNFLDRNFEQDRSANKKVTAGAAFVLTPPT